MYRIYLILILFSFINGVNAENIGNQFELKNIFIEGNGHNSYESEIKANDIGKRRVLMLLANKLGIYDLEINKIPYNILKPVFNVVSISNKESTDIHYSATVNYSYYQEDVNRLLFNNSKKDVKSIAYLYLIIPVLQRGSNLIMWDLDFPWIKHWKQANTFLIENKLLLLQNFIELKNKFQYKDILKIKYKDIAQLFPDKIFYKVAVLICNYKTNASGASYMSVQNFTLDNNENVAPSIKNYSYVVDVPEKDTYAITHKFIKEFITEHTGSNKENIKLYADSNLKGSNKETAIRKISMITDIYNKTDYNVLYSKLSKIESINSFDIDRTIGSALVQISTYASDYELAEQFYMQGLSYSISDEGYTLYNILTGA